MEIVYKNFPKYLICDKASSFFDVDVSLNNEFPVKIKSIKLILLTGEIYCNVIHDGDSYLLDRNEVLIDCGEVHKEKTWNFRIQIIPKTPGDFDFNLQFEAEF